jgi:hypothetical protein
VVSTTLTAAAIALAASLVFSTPTDAPSAAAAPQVPLAPAALPSPAKLVATTLPDLSAVDATASPAPGEAPAASDGAAVSQAKPARVSPRRTGKAKRAAGKRQRVSRRDEPYSIKRGR